MNAKAYAIGFCENYNSSVSINHACYNEYTYNVDRWTKK